MTLDSDHVATVHSEERPGQNGTWWRGTCSCGRYRSGLWAEPERAGRAAAAHVRDKTAGEDLGPLRGLQRGTPLADRAKATWTRDGVTRIRYADDHGRLNVADVPPWSWGTDTEPSETTRA